MISRSGLTRRSCRGLLPLRQGTCTSGTTASAAGRSSRPRGSEHPGRGLRVEIAPGLERFTDALLGPQEPSPADQGGDLLVRDRDGHWTYQFTVTCDDERQGITLVIRGEDLLSRPEEVIGRAAAAAGLIDGIAPIEARAVRDLFD